MGALCFDRFARAPTTAPSRRFVLHGLVAAGLGVASAPPPSTVDARKRKQKLKLNAFGCVNVGKFCKRDEQCRPGICRGMKGKKKCQGHDAGVGCRDGQPAFDCHAPGVQCTTGTGFFRVVRYHHRQRRLLHTRVHLHDLSQGRGLPRGLRGGGGVRPVCRLRRTGAG